MNQILDEFVKIQKRSLMTFFCPRNNLLFSPAPFYEYSMFTCRILSTLISLWSSIPFNWMKKIWKKCNLNVYQAKLTVFKFKTKPNSVPNAKKKKIQTVDTFLETKTHTHTNEMSENKKHKAQNYTTRSTPCKILINLLQ